MTSWEHPTNWLRLEPAHGSGEWHYTVYVDEHGLLETVFVADPSSELEFEALRPAIRERLQATLDLTAYPPNHPAPLDLDAPTLCIRVTSSGQRAAGGPLGAPDRLLTHTWRDLLLIGLQEVR